MLSASQTTVGRHCQSKIGQGGQGEQLALRDDKTQPLPLFLDEPRDHPLSRDDVCSVSALAAEC